MSDTIAMTIAVEFEVRLESTSTEDWLDTWGVRAQDALEFEPSTTAYEAAVACDDPNRVLVFERYEGGDATLREHMNRPAHEALMQKMQAARMTKRRPWMAMGYEVEDFGWRFSNKAENGITDNGAVIGITAIHAPDAASVVEMLRLHADHSLEPGSGTLLYGLSTVDVDDTKDYDLRKGDLVVTRVFENIDARESDAVSTTWDSVRAKLSQIGGSVIFSRAYTTTGSGFVWKGTSLPA